MSEVQKRIEQVEAKAAESELLSRLSVDPEARLYNRRLAIELREFAAKLRARPLELAA